METIDYDFTRELGTEAAKTRNLLWGEGGFYWVTGYGVYRNIATAVGEYPYSQGLRELRRAERSSI